MSKFVASPRAPMVTLHLWHPTLQPSTPSPLSTLSSLTVPLSALIASSPAGSAGLGAAPRFLPICHYDLVSAILENLHHDYYLPPDAQHYLGALLDHIATLRHSHCQYSRRFDRPGMVYYPPSSSISLCHPSNPTCPLDPSAISSLLHAGSPTIDYIIRFHSQAEVIFNLLMMTAEPPPHYHLPSPRSYVMSSEIVPRSSNDGSGGDAPSCENARGRNTYAATSSGAEPTDSVAPILPQQQLTSAYDGSYNAAAGFDSDDYVEFQSFSTPRIDIDESYAASVKQTPLLLPLEQVTSTVNASILSSSTIIKTTDIDDIHDDSRGAHLLLSPPIVSRFDFPSITLYMATTLLGAVTPLIELLLLILRWLHYATSRLTSSLPYFGFNIYFKCIEPEPPPSNAL